MNKQIVDVAIKEYKEKVFCKKAFTEERKAARQMFIERLDIACDLGVMSVEEHREIVSRICRVEREERRQAMRDDAKRMNELLKA